MTATTDVRYCAPCRDSGIRAVATRRLQVEGRRVATCEPCAARLDVTRRHGDALSGIDAARWESDVLRAVWQTVTLKEWRQAERYAQRRCEQMPGADTGAVRDALLDAFARSLLDACRARFPAEPTDTLSRQLLPGALSDSACRIVTRDALRRAAFRSVNIRRVAFDAPDGGAAPLSIATRETVDRLGTGARRAPSAEDAAIDRLSRPQRRGIWRRDALDAIGAAEAERLAIADRRCSDLRTVKAVGRARVALRRAAAEYIDARDALDAWTAEAERAETGDAAPATAEQRRTVAPVGSRLDGSARAMLSRAPLSAGAPDRDGWRPRPIPSAPAEDRPCARHGYVRCAVPVPGRAHDSCADERTLLGALFPVMRALSRR